MDKSAILGWLAKIHSRKDKLRFNLPDVPNIGDFVHYSNKFHWNKACAQEMVALGKASSLHFSEYSNRKCSPVERPWSRAEHAAMLRRDDAKLRAVQVGFFAADTAYAAPTCGGDSSQASSPGSQGNVSG
ncbi:hypothetical protein M758_UG022200 [Ceratodon purpureus]|nr:hypothetical protein M758_UG022200 [Ceratodon purpureus]